MRRGIRSMRLLGVDGPTFPELFAASRDAMKARVPGARDRVPAAVGVRLRRRGDVPAHPRGGLDHARPVRRQTKDAGGTTHRGLGGVPAARHLRIPDRSHPRDRRRGRPVGRPRGVRRAHARAAHPREGRRAIAQAALADHSVYREFRGKGETVFTGYTDLETESTRARRHRRRRRGRPRDRRGRSPRSSSPTPRCTPSPAVRSPTRASSSDRATSSTCSTCRSPSPG